jgi:tetratricopeptide (TPR) repeat protein
MNATVQFICPQCSHTMQVHEAIRTWTCPICGKPSAVTGEEIAPEANRVEESVVKTSEGTPNDATSPVNPESGPTSSRRLPKFGRFLVWGFCFLVITQGIFMTLAEFGVIVWDTARSSFTLPAFLLGGFLGVSTKASSKTLIIVTICFPLTIGFFGPLIGFNAKRAVSEYEKGFVLHKQGDADAAFACFTRAIELKPDFVLPYIGRGFIYKDQGDHGEAIADFNEVIRLEPTRYDGYLYRGGSYLLQGEHDKAIADYNKAIQLDATVGGIYFERGVAYRLIGENTKASSDFLMAKELGFNPDP